MDDNQRLEKIEKQLEGHGHKLDIISTTLHEIAVQNEKIRYTEMRLNELWRQWDCFTEPEGPLSQIQKAQASCPKDVIGVQWKALGLCVTVQVVMVGWLLLHVSSGG